ncbi:MAG: O-antigen ligase family protein [Bacteroidetes bacterium]|nr:O-antigen ligase family protein [Bacteroidota bacterium]
MHVYLAGCVIGSLLLLGHAFTLWREGVPGAFYYMKLSWFFHSAYFAMYLNLPMAFIVIELLKRYKILSAPLKTVYYLLLAWFFVFIFLLSSKMGLICMVLIALLGSAELIFRHKKTFLGLGLIILFMMFIRAGLHVFSGTSDRVIQSTSTLSGSAGQETSKSTSDRLDIWKVSLDIIKSNLWIGVGTGDVKDVLIGKYKENKIKEALEFKLNAHNQYLQTFMTLGIPGITALLLMLVLPMISAFRKRYLLYFVFILLFAANILVESMFETQAGVVWYAFFNIILFSMKREE